jgi:stress-induced morphogen
MNTITSTMAKSLLIRPQLTALYAAPPILFNARRCYLTAKPYLSIRKAGLHIHVGSRTEKASIFGGLRKFSVRGINVNAAGSIDSPLMESMKKKIQEDLNAESVSVVDASGDGRHVIIDVVASAFEGKSAVNRQRMVYKAITEELQGTVHAVDQMTTKTPAEAGL